MLTMLAFKIKLTAALLGVSVSAARVGTYSHVERIRRDAYALYRDGEVAGVVLTRDCTVSASATDGWAGTLRPDGSLTFLGEEGPEDWCHAADPDDIGPIQVTGEVIHRPIATTDGR